MDKNVYDQLVRCIHSLLNGRARNSSARKDRRSNKAQTPPISKLCQESICLYQPLPNNTLDLLCPTHFPKLTSTAFKFMRKHCYRFCSSHLQKSTMQVIATPWKNILSWMLNQHTVFPASLCTMSSWDYLSQNQAPDLLTAWPSHASPSASFLVCRKEFPPPPRPKHQGSLAMSGDRPSQSHISTFQTTSLKSCFSFCSPG